MAAFTTRKRGGLSGMDGAKMRYASRLLPFLQLSAVLSRALKDIIQKCYDFIFRQKRLLLSLDI